MCVGLVSFSQKNNYGIGVGTAIYSVNTNKSSVVGVNLSIFAKRFYFDISSNFSKGNGTYLEFASNSTYHTSKIETSVINIGFILPISDKISVIPYVGVGMQRPIYEDPILFPTYFYGKTTRYFSCGIVGRHYVSDRINIYLGGGVFELLKGGISYSF